MENSGEATVVGNNFLNSVRVNALLRGVQFKYMS